VYGVDRAGLVEVRDYLEKFWDEALDAFKAAAEGETEGDDDA
jgi:hypothetical protein